MQLRTHLVVFVKESVRLVVGITDFTGKTKTFIFRRRLFLFFIENVINTESKETGLDIFILPYSG